MGGITAHFTFLALEAGVIPLEWGELGFVGVGRGMRGRRIGHGVSYDRDQLCWAFGDGSSVLIQEIVGDR